VGRRRFEHLHVELSVAVGSVVPRYELWLHLHALGWNPEELARESIIEFASEHMSGFLADCGLSLSPRAARRLERDLRRFDPSHPTPDEVMRRLFAGS
jgi:hypothetical protein